MDFDQSDLVVTLLLVVLGISVLIAIAVIAKAIINDAKENKAREARLAAEEKTVTHESQAPVKPKPKPKAKAKAKPAPAAKAKAVAQKDDVNEGDDLVAAAEVYLTYELKEQAITSLEKHLMTHPTDKRALALLKKAEASK
jgi:heme exporter protein D